MKITTITCAFVAAGAVGFLGAPTALADGPSTTAVGGQGKLVDAAGNIVQSWTITNLKTSSDVIPYPVAGTLWEATATDEAVQGGATPIVSNLNARAGDGENYRALFGVATPQGVNPATLAQGQKTTGKVYFDVTGAAPVAVVYNAGGQDLLVWAQAAPQQPRTGGSRGTGSGGGTAAAESALPEVATAPVEGAPLPASTESTPLAPAGQGTPIPAAGQGTPLAPAGQGTPIAPAGQGTPLPAAGQGTPVPAAGQGTPIPAAGQGTPLPAAGQGTPVPAAVEGTPAVVSPTPAPGAQAKSTG